MLDLGYFSCFQICYHSKHYIFLLFDYAEGGDGNDHIIGESGDDELYGNGDDESIFFVKNRSA